MCCKQKRRHRQVFCDTNTHSPHRNVAAILRCEFMNATHSYAAEQHTFYSASVNPRKGSEQSIAYALCHHHRRCLFQLSEFTVRLERASRVTSNRNSESNRFSLSFCLSRGWMASPQVDSIATNPLFNQQNKTKQFRFCHLVLRWSCSSMSTRCLIMNHNLCTI